MIDIRETEVGPRRLWSRLSRVVWLVGCVLMAYCGSSSMAMEQVVMRLAHASPPAPTR